MEKSKAKLFKKSDFILISKIAERAQSTVEGINYLEVFLCIKGTHLYVKKLDLKKLLEFDDNSFEHDVYGICRNFNMKTVELDNCFKPRCTFQEVSSIKN